MNSLIKEAEVLIVYETCKIITNVNVNEIIETLISNKKNFNKYNQLSLKNEDICKFLKEFKDKNTMFKMQENEIITLKRNIRFIFHKNPVRCDGMFSLHIQDINSEIHRVYIFFRAENIGLTIFDFHYNSKYNKVTKI